MSREFSTQVTPAISWEAISQPNSQDRQRRRPTTPPRCLSCHTRSYIRWIAREKLVAENNVIRMPMMPVVLRTASASIPVPPEPSTLDTPSWTAAWPPPVMPRTSSKRSTASAIASWGRKEASTIRSGSRASRAWAPMTIARSTTSTLTSSSTVRRTGGTVSRIR